MNKKNFKYIIMGAVGLTIVSGLVIYNKVFNAKHRQISEETAEFIIPAEDLQFHFANDQESATKKYMDKVVEIYGSITEVEDHLVVLEDRILVDFMNGVEQGTNKGDRINIKGRCVGFDELLLLVKIDQATTIKIK